MDLQQYYLDELSYLRDLGEEFARDNPNVAQFLSRQSNDPDVERLLEGFAFLTARLRQKLDDELPELSHSLLQVLWPQYLRPVPSCSLVEFATAGPPVTLPKGTMVQARPGDGTRCRVQTAFETTGLPLRVAGLQAENGVATGDLVLRLANTSGASGEKVPLDRLRLHLAAEREPQIARMLYQWLRVHLRAVRVVAGELDVTLPGSAAHPVGFGAADGLLPYPPTAFEGFRHIQEYFAFPDKFMFVELRGLDCLRGIPAGEFTITLRFDRPLPDRLRVTAQHIRLNCSPVINLFPHDAQPLSVDHKRTEYRIRPAGVQLDHYGIFSVNEVVGWTRANNVRTVYRPFEAFTSTGSADRHFYRVRVKPAVVRGRPETYLSFVTPQGGTLLPPSETVVIGASCTNARLAEHLPAGSIDESTGPFPAAVTFRNITAVSREILPPAGGDLLWRLVANLSRNYGTLTDIASLRAVVGTYELAAVEDQQARRRLDLLLEGLLASRVEPLDWMVRGIPLRGQRMRLTVAESKLGGEYEAYLFGCVLESFLGSYAAINSCQQLLMEGQETRLRFSWPVRFGTREQP